MNSTIKLVKLDFLTVKPYINPINIAIQVAIGLFVGFLVETSLVPFAMMMGLGAGYVNLVFAVGERNNLDILYSSLNIKRSDVVSGRYAYVLLVNIGLGIFSCILIFTAAALTGRNWPMPSLIVMAVIILFQYLTIEAVQLPIYFRSGFAGSKAFSSLSYIMYITVFALIMFLNNNDGWVFIAENALMVVFVLVLLSFLLLASSFRLACKFYAKRDL